MDSPVIVDAASKFGRGIDLDRAFPGFPFDDDDSDNSFGRRSDGIRAHLDDLASRHPELAEHLLGPPWGDAPLHGSLLRGRRRRRGSGSSGGQGYQGHQVDEDARSQASGSSAASGASAVSSHSGEPDSSVPTSIPHYGLRNTVDIGQQQRRDMENPEKGERGQRSMSAPPENRQQQQPDQSRQQQQPQGQRFVSRVDITPQHNQQRAQSPKQQPPSASSNVRHIPIFVEGRDEPVMPKVAEDASPPSSYQRQPSPPQFHRPSHFNEHFARQQWPPPHFQNAFYDQGFEQPMRRHQQYPPPPQQHNQQYYQQPQQQPQYYNQQSQQPQYFNKQPQQSQYYNQQYQQPPQQQQQPQQPHNQQQPAQQQQQEAAKPKPPVPKDPLEKVAQVQKEVDNLAEQVQRYVGGSRQDKEYVYLDEMLTRELIKLDDIETEGRENVRQARKNAIKSIQDTISLLETKAPLAGQQEQPRGEEECAEKNQREEAPQTEAMEVDTKQEKPMNEPIPLPPAPSSPTETKAESSDKESGATAVPEAANQSVTAAKEDTERTEVTAGRKTEESRATETAEAVVAPTATDESVRETSENPSKTGSDDGKNAERKNGDVMTQTEKGDSMAVATLELVEKEAKEGGKTEDGQKPRLLKKAKKTKKQPQQPVSEQAIPLPPPPPTESAK
ncbi:PREDICTED: BAG domain-containing protein Samui-like isoform X2 [Dinoponera quadriceps]|uniref:BAG domain-containing protein Samui-like isoform X2 n=1 Tax=Dinoponera quadriceps TaxID=609295 RepID=A0A6P3X044_DINQU|nr:PREDICTED: BAG domain-containing protein Samui-like isoform X2 [Dinoponera quadriceps]